MKSLYAVLFGAALGAASVFIHASAPPFGLILSIAATFIGIWSIGRMWGRRSLKVIAGFIWTLIVVRAGLPGASHEYLIEASSIGISLINLGFILLLIAILLPN